MEIINLASNAYTNYIVKQENFYILIDAGNKITYNKLVKKLASKGILSAQIKYVFLTHAHADHLGYLEELLSKNPQITVICHKNARDYILKGVDNITKYTSSLTKAFSKITNLLKTTPAKWHPFDIEQFAHIYVTEDTEINGIGKAVTLFGHTLDSIGLVINNVGFVGDALLDVLGQKGIPFLIEDEQAFYSSVDKLINLNCSEYYLGHGSCKKTDFIKKNYSRLKKLTLY